MDQHLTAGHTVRQVITAIERRAEISNQHGVQFRRFKRACAQILQLNSKLDALSKRFRVAKKTGDQIFRYTLRNRMLVVEGVLQAYFKYANLKKQQIIELRRQLQLTDLYLEDSDSDNSEE